MRRIFRHTIGNQRGVQRLLRAVDPGEQPAQIADRQCVVVLHAEGAGIVERAVADHAHHRHAQRRADGQRFHGIHPANAAGATEHAGAANRRVLDDLEL